ncbi:MAG TPA: hypothetical protein VHV52_11205 [Gaiellaceae bacterium]|jgi:hypothetical protein|nr:hypothetical protein [Gaiellaceae bacterium]
MSRDSVRPSPDHLVMETTFRVLTWAGVIAAAAVATALLLSTLLPS